MFGRTYQLYIYIYIYIYENDLQLGKLKENCFATQALSQTQKNVSEPQTQKLKNIQKHFFRFWKLRKFSENFLKILKTFFWVCDKAWVAKQFSISTHFVRIEFQNEKYMLELDLFGRKHQNCDEEVSETYNIMRYSSCSDWPMCFIAEEILSRSDWLLDELNFVWLYQKCSELYLREITLCYKNIITSV